MITTLTPTQKALAAATSSNPTKTDVSTLTAQQLLFKKVTDATALAVLGTICGFTMLALTFFFHIIIFFKEINSAQAKYQITSPLSGEQVDVTPADWAEFKAYFATAIIFNFLIEEEHNEQ